MKFLMLSQPSKPERRIQVTGETDEYWMTSVGTFKKASGRHLGDPRWKVYEIKPIEKQA